MLRRSATEMPRLGAGFPFITTSTPPGETVAGQPSFQEWQHQVASDQFATQQSLQVLRDAQQRLSRDQGAILAKLSELTTALQGEGAVAATATSTPTEYDDDSETGDHLEGN